MEGMDEGTLMQMMEAMKNKDMGACVAAAGGNSSTGAANMAQLAQLLQHMEASGMMPPSARSAGCR